MPRKKFKCTKCSRTFSMPAHLARHMNTIHASPAARAARQRRAGRKGNAGRRPGSTAVLAVGDVSFTDSANLLSGIQAYHESLLARRDQIDREVSALGNALSALGSTQVGSAKSVRQKRGRRGAGAREGSLKDFILKVLGRRSTPVTPMEIAALVMRSGYKSRAKDLSTAVNSVLPELKAVKRVGFGLYSLR